MKNLGLLLLMVGAGLIVWGYKASQSVGSKLSSLLTGTPTDQTLYLYLAGGAAVIAGIYLVFIKRHKV